MKFLSFGELLLRLASPGYTRLLQKDQFEATFCGGEANVAVALANFGIDSSFFTVLPNNDIGHSACRTLRYFGVDTSKVMYTDGRMGLYYLEKGASQRPSKVIYDRKYSTISMIKKEDIDWDCLFKDVDWFHWTGINPALSLNMREVMLEALKSAKTKGITVSCDLNYRKNLWSSEEAQNEMKKLMKYVDVCFANEEDAEKVLGIFPESNDVIGGKLNFDGYKQTAKQICDNFGCSYAAITLRESYSASRNGWSGMLYNSKTQKSYYSQKYDIQIVDRVGGGDSFTAALIYGIMTKKSDQEIIDFAAAASCLKHTIEGDFNRVTIEEVQALIKNGGNGRVDR